MLAALNRSTTRAGWRWFQGLFFIAALLAVFATFAAISGVSPVDPTQGGIAWLLGLNFALIAVLAWLTFRRYLAMRGAERPSGGHRLARRFLLLFGASAIIPAAIVAIFLGATITRGLDNWFNERIDTIVRETAEVARRYLDDYSDALDQEGQLMAGDMDNAAEGLRTDAELYEQYLSRQAAIREFNAAYVVTRSGDRLAKAAPEDSLPYVPPPGSAFDEADTTGSAQTLYERAGLATGLFPLTETGDAYLYVFKPFDPGLLAQMRRAEAALSDYRDAKDRSGRLQWLFAVGYAQLAALVLLLSGRLGLEAAGQITGPIGRLADAATAVRDGDLSVRVPPPLVQDEVHDLTRSFNTMTEQLAEQRRALITAREEAEDRRQFVETLLASVSAGVIRTDPGMVITLANTSAGALFDRDDLQGRELREVAPDFEPYAMQVLDHGPPVDASLDITLGDKTRHFRLKAAQDPAGGCVLTFDDATRLVTAQRQLAWRDVARRIAHEIRNPLTPIQLSTERLRRRYKPLVASDDEVFDRCIDTILRQVADIGRMVEEFSSFARMPKPTVAEFDLGALLNGLSFGQRMVSPDIVIDLDRPEGPLPYLGDERLLAQALGNLIKNAAEAIEGLPEDADVTGRIDVRLGEAAGGEIEILIADNGPGFQVETRDRLLEPYVTTREKGTGLGLAIVNRIIMDHGGSISLRDRADGRRGACVQIVLPRHSETRDTVRAALGVEEPIA